MAAKINRSLPERKREKGRSRQRDTVNREPMVIRGLLSHGPFPKVVQKAPRIKEIKCKYD